MPPSRLYQVQWLDQDAVLADGSPDMSFLRSDAFGNISAAIQFARSVSRRNAVVWRIVTMEGWEITGTELTALIGEPRAAAAKTMAPLRLS